MNIQENHDLRSLNSFGLPAQARYFCTLDDPGGIGRLREWQAAHPDLPLLFLGGGSNLLFAGDFPGLVAQVRLESLEDLGEDADYRYIRAGAGNNWHRFVRWTIDRGYAGLENLALIPGTVGAAPMQNIGAYGVELKDCLQSVRAVDWRSGEVSDFSREECRFGYRDSFFKSVEPDRWLILSVTFALPREPRWHTGYAGLRELLEGKALNARVISDAVIALRQSKLPDPAEIGNAGSFFKNPLVSAGQWAILKEAHPGMPGWPQPGGSVKTSAGWLIDQCGWKGRREGNVGTYAKHALVLVNHGGATGAEVWRFAQGIIASVLERFGIRLEPEPRVIGD